MTIGNTSSNSSLRPQIWQKKLFADIMAELYFTQNGMMGTDENNIVQIMDELTKEKGDRVTFGLVTRLTGAGVSGDSELEGQEEQMNSYAESVLIDLMRHAVRIIGCTDLQKASYDQRMAAKSNLKMWAVEFIERQIFLKMGGVTNTSLTDVAGTVVGTNAAWSNTPTYIPDADEAWTGNKYRYLNAGKKSLASFTTADTMTLALVSQAKVKAQLSNPKIQPLRVNGENYYMMFLHPWQTYDIKRSDEWQKAQREADKRGPTNKIFTGALGIHDNVILKEHEYVPYLDVSVAGNSFRSASAGTDCAVDIARAMLCGRQAVGFAKAKYDKGWVEKEFDYDNSPGIATGVLGGIDKLMFNSKEYGVISVDTAVNDPTA